MALPYRRWIATACGLAMTGLSAGPAMTAMAVAKALKLGGPLVSLKRCGFILALLGQYGQGAPGIAVQ